MSQPRCSWLVPRKIVISILVAAFVCGASLVAQQAPSNPAQSQSSQEATVPYGQTQDNLPPLPDESAPPAPGGAVPPSAQAPVPPAPSAVVPPSLTVPAGTLVTVRLMGGLSSDINQQGDTFSATLERPIVVAGWVVAHPGQIAIGKVVSVQKAGRVKGVSSLGITLSEMPVVDGSQLQVASQLVQTSAGPSKGRDAVAIASITGLGAAIGGAVDDGTGAGIGAAAGVVAGIAGVLLTPGRPTVMPPETLLTFRLLEPVTINTQHSTMAFHLVNQQDYASAGPPLPRRPVGPPYPLPPGPVYPYGYPPPYAYPYPYAAVPYWGFYPSVSVYYGRGYGWGPGRWR